jgi:hypothetical protein
VPVAIVGDLEQDELARAERVERLSELDKSGRRKPTARVNVATSAHTKLRHIVRVE